MRQAEAAIQMGSGSNPEATEGRRRVAARAQVGLGVILSLGLLGLWCVGNGVGPLTVRSTTSAPAVVRRGPAEQPTNSAPASGQPAAFARPTRTAPSLAPAPPAHYLQRVRQTAATATFAREDDVLPGGLLPGASGPKVTVRGRQFAKNSIYFRGPRGYVTLHDPDRLPGRDRLLLFGASAVYGDRVAYDETVGALLETTLASRLGRPGLRVVNLARPAWELNSVAMLMRRVIPWVSPKPLAVVLCTGNNEFLSYNLPGQRGGVFGGPLGGQDPTYFRGPDWGPIPHEVAGTRLFQLCRGLDDARFWPAAQKVYLDRYKQTLTELVLWLKKLNIPLLLLSPPINTHLFVGGLQPQPVTFRPLGRAAYRELRLRLERALEEGDEAAVARLAAEVPDGPIQRYLLAQQLAKRGRTQQARAEFLAARDLMMGPLSSLPAMARVMDALASPGVTVVNSAFLYPKGSTWRRSRQLFNDTCHLSPLAHQRLAQHLAPKLRRLIESN